MTETRSLKSPDGKSRQRILALLKQQGALSAQALADELSISAMAVRQHLYALQERQLVGFQEVPQKLGRPQKQWRLTPAADQYFPNAHNDLALELIDAVSQAFGPSGLQTLIDRRTEKQRAKYLKRIGKAKTLATRLKKLAALRSEEGYMASIEPLTGEDTGPGWLLVENHCPVCDAARACQGLCASELQLFRDVLGDNVEVVRVEHILNKARRCAYRITPVTGAP